MARAPGRTGICPDNAAQGYGAFDAGAPKKFAPDPHGLPAKAA